MTRMTTGETDRHAGRRTDICSQSEVGWHPGSYRILAAEMFTLIFFNRDWAEEPVCSLISYVVIVTVYMYWSIRCDSSSPYIHPVGWCEEQGRPLTSPQGTLTYLCMYSPVSWNPCWRTFLFCRSSQPRELCVGRVSTGNWFYCCSQFSLSTGEDTGR